MVTLYSGDDVGWPNGMTLHHEDRLELEVEYSSFSFFCKFIVYFFFFCLSPC